MYLGLALFFAIWCGVPFAECWLRGNKAFTVIPKLVRSPVLLRNNLMDTSFELDKNLFEYSDSIQENELLQLFKEQVPLLHNRDTLTTKVSTPRTINHQHPREDMIQRAVALTALVPVEIIHNGNIHFGNVISGTEDASSVTVRLSSGNEVKIDKAQIISVWEELNNDSPPVSPAGWADVTAEAMTILRQLPSRKLQLEEFWKAIQMQPGLNSRDSSFGIDSQDLSVFTFQESKFPLWIDPSSPAVSSFFDGQSGAIVAPSAAQRMAMALLLFHDNVHFKRRVSVHAWPEESTVSSLTHADTLDLDLDLDDTDIEVTLGRKRKPTKKDTEKRKKQLKHSLLAQESAQKRQPLTYIKEGGYRLVDEATVRNKETDLFLQYYHLQRRNSSDNSSCSPWNSSASVSKGSFAGTQRSESPVHTAIIRRYLRDLELYVMTSLAKPTMAPPKPLSTLLKRCTLPPSHVGTRDLLMQIGRDVSQTYSPTIYTKPNRVNKDNNLSTSEEIGQQCNETQTTQRIINITPWSSEVLEAANQLVQELTTRRTTLLTQTPLPVSSGKKNNLGYFDYRSSRYPPICIDSPSSSFSDDAFQFHPETNELLIHVTDIPLNPTSHSTKYAPLTAACQERILSCYLPSGPVHMLPSTALQVLSLSPEYPNEVITVAVKMDCDTGRVVQTRVFPSWIGPVEKLTIPQVDRILTSSFGDQRRGVVGVSQKVSQSLHLMNDLVKKLLVQDPYWNDNYASKAARQTDGGLEDDEEEDDHDSQSGAFRMLNTLLSMYAHVAYTSLSGIQTNTSSVPDLTRPVSSIHTNGDTHLPAPVAWEHWDRRSQQPSGATRDTQTLSQWSLASVSGRIRRFATQPLRSYVSLLQQRQVKAALRLETGVSRSACVAAVRVHNAKRRQLARLLSPHSKL